MITRDDAVQRTLKYLVHDVESFAAKHGLEQLWDRAYAQGRDDMHEVMEEYQRTRGQRCDGSGKLQIAGYTTVPARCPGCPTCQLKATPSGDAVAALCTEYLTSIGSIRTPDTCDLSWARFVLKRDGSGARESVSTAEDVSRALPESAAPVGVESLHEIARQGDPQRAPLLIAFDRPTLRALMAAMCGWSFEPTQVKKADALLAELDKETKP